MVLPYAPSTSPPMSSVHKANSSYVSSSSKSCSSSLNPEVPASAEAATSGGACVCVDLSHGQLPVSGSEGKGAQQPVAIPAAALFQQGTTSRVAPVPQRTQPTKCHSQDGCDSIDKSNAHTAEKAEELAARRAEKKRVAAFSTAATQG